MSSNLKKISSVDLRSCLSEVLNEVRYNNVTHAITRRGKIIAYLCSELQENSDTKKREKGK